MKALLVLLLMFGVVGGQELVARDSSGLIVEIKEKYGSVILDTCTVVMQHNGNFIIVRRDGISGYFPSSFHSVRIVGRVEQVQRLAGEPILTPRGSRTPSYAELLEHSEMSN